MTVVTIIFGVVLVVFGTTLILILCTWCVFYCWRRKERNRNIYYYTEQAHRHEVRNRLSAVGPSTTTNITSNAWTPTTGYESERTPLFQYVKPRFVIQTEISPRTATEQPQRTVFPKSSILQREPIPGIHQPPAVDSESDYERQINAYWRAVRNDLPAWSPTHQPFTQPLSLETKVLNWQPALPTFVYHYTNLAGYDGILQELKILAGGFFEAHNGRLFGDGIYMTVLGPTETTDDLILRNYGNLSTWSKRAKTEYVFQFRSSDLPGLRFINNRAQQTILLHPWSFIDLNACSYQTFRRSIEDYAGMLNEVIPLQRQPNFAARYAPRV